MAGALDGIRILDWTSYHHGSGAGYMLGDLGAEVIHIERRVQGDNYRGMQNLFGLSLTVAGRINLGFETANRNKKSIALDLEKEKGRELLYRLVQKSDVFIVNFRPSVIAKMKMDYETVSKHNPKLIYALATAYGSRGREADKRAFDPLGLARSGLMFNVADRDQKEPSLPIGALCDQMAATLTAYGIIAALLARDRLGIGQQIEVSLLGSMIHLQVLNMNAYLLRGRQMSRHSRTRSRNPLSNMYQCADGKWLILAEPQSDRFWQNFCTATNINQLENDPKFKDALQRRKNCQELIAILNGVFSMKPRDEWLRILEERCSGLSCGPINTLADVPNDPQVVANGYIIDYNHPTIGPVKLSGFPVSFSKTPAAITSRAPEFGEHTEEVLQEVCGYSWEKISQLREEEVI